MSNKASDRYLSEEQWFDRYYPKAWGDWRIHYNLRAFQRDPFCTGCTWMDYRASGWLLMEDENGLMEVMDPVEGSPVIDSFFVRLGPKGEEDIDYAYLQPHFQPATQDYWCHVTVERMESNLDLYLVHIAGSDDSSWSKHYLGQDDLWKDIERILEEGVLSGGSEAVEAMGFFFTN